MRTLGLCNLSTERKRLTLVLRMKQQDTGGTEQQDAGGTEQQVSPRCSAVTLVLVDSAEAVFMLLLLRQQEYDIYRENVIVSEAFGLTQEEYEAEKTRRAWSPDEAAAFATAFAANQATRSRGHHGEYQKG